MSDLPPDLRDELRAKAKDTLDQLSPAEREGLLVKCWMSHDARWFAAVALNFGMEGANRVNKTAVREEGKVEARRPGRALGILPVQTLDDCLLLQETLISLLGPDLLDYRLSAEEDSIRFDVSRCFAYDNVVKAGVASEYDCGIFPRMLGWLDAVGVKHEISPELGRCLKAQGRDCSYTLRLAGSSEASASDGSAPKP